MKGIWHLVSRIYRRRVRVESPQEHCTCALRCGISRIVPCFRYVATYLMPHRLVDSANRQPTGNFLWDVSPRESQKGREDAERERVAKKVGKRSRFLRSAVSTLPWELVHNLCSQPSLKKQPTFLDPTTGFPRDDVWRATAEIPCMLMTWHYPELGSASDWLKQTPLATQSRFG